MKQIVLILVFALAGQIIAGGQPFEKGDKALNVSLGIGSALYSGPNIKMSIPPIAVSFEQGITEKLGIGYIGVGGYVGISGSKYEYPGSDYGYKNTYIIVGGRAAYHFDLVDDLDIYAGVILGVNITSSKEFGDFPVSYVDNSQSTRVAHSEFVGIRWFFKPGFALMAELGYGISYLNLGVAFKF